MLGDRLIHPSITKRPASDGLASLKAKPMKRNLIRIPYTNRRIVAYYVGRNIYMGRGCAMADLSRAIKLGRV